MKRSELLAWLSLSVADIPGWLALVALVMIFLLRNSLADLLLSGAAVGLAVFACVLGRKPNPEFSQRTNTAKKWTYPIFLIMIVIAVVFHFSIWQDLEEKLHKARQKAAPQQLQP